MARLLFCYGLCAVPAATCGGDLGAPGCLRALGSNPGFCAARAKTSIVEGLEPESAACIRPCPPDARTEMAKFFGHMERAPRYLSDTDATNLFESGKNFFNHFGALTRMSLRLQKQEFLLRPKLHVLTHFLMDLKRYRTNPRMFHCYVDEDSMGLLKRICLKAHVRHRNLHLMRCAKLRLRAMKRLMPRLNRVAGVRAKKKR
ncbi:unnamed protein product [Symbiodinium sp. CCMP2592]|nr:unnamed protein product [Symbiodinium sp. CCMP2592]